MTDYTKQLVEQRRELHQWPEEGWTEFWTTNYIVNKLRSWGYEVLLGTKIINPEQVFGRNEKLVQEGIKNALARGVSQSFIDETEGYTGCVALLDTGKEGPTTAFRFDIDCVCVNETDNPEHKPNKEGFRSQHTGFMHACGHDSHISIGLTLAHWIAERKDELKGKFKIVFQPAEEGVRGASAIAASGIVDDADYFLGSHISFMADSGEIVAAPYGLLCTSKFDVTFKGKPAHAGKEPNAGRNALAAACNAVVQMMGIPRHGGGMTRINVGTLRAGEGRNVIPSSAHMALEVRGETSSINDYMVENVKNIVEGIAKGFDVSYEISQMGAAVDFTNDKELSDMLIEVAKTVPGINNIRPDGNFGGSEDISVLGKRVQAHGGKAAFFICGADRVAGHHQGSFDIDEGAFKQAFDMYVGMAKKLNG
ncbi:amidohydrolase [Parasutterella excrementihominis]|uniref:amidohydrolase n=1 Tax=Parasutterella excrementihominis TaxID=487175 RepID=UPI003521CA80